MATHHIAIVLSLIILIRVLFIDLITLQTPAIDSDACPFQPPAYNSSLYIPLRKKLFAKLLESGSLSNNSIIILPTGNHLSRDFESDMEMDGFRHPGNVLYIVGDIPISEGLIGIEYLGSIFGNVENLKVDLKEWKITAFFPSLTVRESVFLGGFPSEEEIVKKHKIDGVLPIEKFDELVKDKVVLSTVDAVYLPEGIEKRNFRLDENVRQAFLESRWTKTFEELDMLKFASQVSAWAHEKVEKRILAEEDVSETKLASYFKYLTQKCHCRLQAYPPIVGAGRSASILHFRTGENETEGFSKITAPKFVLVDAAAEYRGYASDITRTHARKGKITEKMQEIHDIVAKAQENSITAFGVGISWGFVQWVSAYTLTKELMKSGFFNEGSSVFELLLYDAWRVFMPHGLGHPVGLDVHDPPPQNPEYLSGSDAVNQAQVANLAKDLEIGRRLPNPPKWYLSSLQRGPKKIWGKYETMADYTIVPGQIFTIEPGIYFIPVWFDYIKSLGEDGPARFVNWEKVEKYIEVGGVRIEDVISVDYYGKKEILSRL
ncbi:hypothetical protein HK098_003027 [Nowakowskiella sp. JEL0407]|nr:hypothetical protein HK098_003027 [Nowakowskiella sp. JEL0407]